MEQEKFYYGCEFKNKGKNITLYDTVKDMSPNRFIPTVDHLVSPDIKEEDFMYYLELKNEM